MFGKIPLAWLQLSHQKMRLLVAVAGISFADILMFMQLGFRDALFDSAVKFHTNIQGDVFLISPKSTSLITMKTFSRRRLYQAKSVNNVATINPIYISFNTWRNPEDKTNRRIMVIGFNPSNREIFMMPGVRENINQILRDDSFIFDAKSRTQFGDVRKWFNAGQKITTEVDNRKIQINGLFEMGASFGADGSILSSDTNFIRLTKRDSRLVDIGVIQIKPGSNSITVAQELKEIMPKDVKVLTKVEFMDFERKYWQEGTSIGFIFTLGTVMGFIVGIVIVYQILYTDVTDHLSEYATLKAMGYADTYLLSVVFQEAIILAVIGFVPGTFMAIGLYTMTRNATNLPLIMTIARATIVLILTIVMCLFSGTIAVRKLRTADPADLF
jgi:putative ABC transport system permease protein